MANADQESYYHFKFLPRQVALENNTVSAIGTKVVATGPTVNAAATATELKIQKLLTLGHGEYYAGRYGPALEYYLKAWGTIPRILWPHIPVTTDHLTMEQLHNYDFNPALLELAQLHLTNIKQGVSNKPLPPITLKPPTQLTQAMAQILPEAISQATVSQTTVHIDRSLHFLAIGDGKTAQQEVNLAQRLANNTEHHRELQQELQMTLAAVKLYQGQHQQAAEQFAALKDQANDPSTVAAIEHNMGVALRLAGRTEEADQLFRRAAAYIDTPSLDTPSIATPSTTPSQQTLGANMPLLLPRTQTWTRISLPQSQKTADYFLAYSGNTLVSLNLQGDIGDEIETKLLLPRIQAKHLSALHIPLELATQFITYLSHVGGFVLPMAIGDAYSALGEYDKAIRFYQKARDYKYLNLSIERPVVWIRMARAYVRKGLRQYRERDMAGAQASLEHLVKIVGDDLAFDGPLYSGTFSAFKVSHKKFLQAADRVAYSALSFQRRILLLNAHTHLEQILAGINYLGFPHDIVPIHNWVYLKNLAAYFAQQAIQAERTYLSFKNTAEKEQMTRLALEQSVQAQQAAVAVEEQRLAASHSQRDVAVLSANTAALRLQNAIERKADYEAVSAELAVLDEINAWATGPMDKANIDGAWAEVLGMAPGTYDTYQVVRRVSALRSQISQAFELRDKQRQIDELAANKAVADGQVAVADKMLAVAQAQLEMAQLRAANAQAQLDAFTDQELTPELWHTLADNQREISETYLDQAISIAFLMERAFEFEYDLDVKRIRFDYARSELQGLLSADFLLQDINQFSLDRALHTEKQLPVKTTLSLADRFPHQFFQEFMRSGKLEFETLLEDFDHAQPGGHIRKLRRIEVVVEGAIGREGVRGRLSNSGISRYRDRSGEVKIRVQKPETQLLSLYDMRRDGFVFSLPDAVLEVFENSGVASGWTLEIPPASNDINYAAISNIHLTFYYDSFYSKAIEQRVRAELAATALYEHQLGIRLSAHFPDEFFALQDSGEVTVDLDTSLLPHNHQQARIQDLRIVVHTAAGVSAANLNLNISAHPAGITLTQTTDAKGMINTDSATAPLNALIGTPLQGQWTLLFDKAANGPAIAAGFDWDKVDDIYFFVEYHYLPRGQQRLSDDFSTDPMAQFEVVDDSAATSGSPSSWSYSHTGFIEQTTAIAGGPTGPDNTSVERPGTYLLRQVNSQWPNTRDLCLQGRLQSLDKGGIGFVFRYQDADHFYYCLIDTQQGLIRIGKKIAGVFAELQQPAINTDTLPFAADAAFDISLAMVGDAAVVYLNGEQVLFGRDADIHSAGRIGLLSWGNTKARFFSLQLESL